MLRGVRRALVGFAVRRPRVLAAGSAGRSLEPARQSGVAHAVPELPLSPRASPPSDHALVVPGRKRRQERAAAVFPGDLAHDVARAAAPGLTDAR